MVQTHHDHNHECHHHHGHDDHHHNRDDDRHHHHEHEYNHDHAALAGFTEGPKEYQGAHERAHTTDIRRRLAGKEVTNGQILLFGLTDGLISCPAAVTVLLICIQLKVLMLGTTMVPYFDLGLALTSATVGVGVTISVQQTTKHWNGFSAMVRKAPYFSSAFIAMVGLYMGIHGYMGIVN